MAIFNSYVSLPEGNANKLKGKSTGDPPLHSRLGIAQVPGRQLTDVGRTWYDYGKLVIKTVLLIQL